VDRYILGKYLPLNTLVHKLDPRMKILAMILLMVGIFMPYPTWTFTFVMSGFYALVIFTLMLISKVRLRDLIIQLKSIWFLLIILMIINIFLPPAGSIHIIAQSGTFKLYAESFMQTGKIMLRLMEMFGVAMILTATTSPQELSFGFAWFLKPLKKIKFPVEEVSMTVSIALRFIPTLLEETNRIYKAQSSRGVDFKHGNLKMKFKGLIALIIPLFVSAFTMSDDLAFALEARGYNPRETRTSYRVLKWSIDDTISIILVTLFVASIITISIMKLDLIKFYIPYIW